MENKTLEKIILEIAEAPLQTRTDLDSFKRKTAKKYRIPCFGNIDLLAAYRRLNKQGIVQKNRALEELLRVRPVRSLSGIVNVSVLTKPWPCPGRCIFCPQEPGIPKSYVSGEPAVERAKLLKYNPYLQTQKRFEALELEGHPIDKVEIRIIGGTWSYYPASYQSWFVGRCLQACNEFPISKKSKIQNPLIASQLQGAKRLVCNVKKNPKSKCQNLEKEQKKNETAKCRIVGITVETRPDFIDIEEIKRMRRLGITRVELGAQSVYDDVLRLNRRGHGVEATIKATKLLKDAGFKVSYQMMPNLPGSNLKRDVEMFEELFSSPDFKPDLLKIYPLALVKNSPLHQLRFKRKHRPYSENDLTKLLVKIKTKIPYYARIERIIRDIPSKDIIGGGAKISNLREVVQKELKKNGLQCKCIRCREVRGDYEPKEMLELFREDYEASGGKEIFLSFENKNRAKLYALLRLRISSCLCAFTPELKNSAVIREVHTYGQMASVGTRSSPTQHKGLGKELIRQAEKIAEKEFNMPKMAVIASVGTRLYYRKLGYRLRDTYMIKKL